MVDVESPKLKKMCDEFMRMRQERMDNILSYLRLRDVRISREDVFRQAAGEYVGRPHIAAAMVQAGYVHSIKEAFLLHLTGEDFKKVQRPKPTAKEGIDTILSSGGTAVLAHPHSLKLGDDDLDIAVSKLKAMGLQGMECFYGTYDGKQSERYLRIAEKHGLVATGGSDFHGHSVKPNIEIGSGENNLFCFNDMDIIQKLQNARI
jgi:predicted metal-dependent phosphoesterase TrpH